MSSSLVAVGDLPHRGQGTLATTIITAGSVILTDRPLLKINAAHANNNGSTSSRHRHLTDAAIQNAYESLSPASKKLFNTLDAGDPWSLYPDIKNKRVRRVLINGFALGDKFQTWIVCPLISRLNHSCVPNASWYRVPDTEEYKLLALKDIAQNEEVTLCYRDELDAMPSSARRQVLLEQWGFVCQCTACGPFELPSSKIKAKATPGPLTELQQRMQSRISTPNGITTASTAPAITKPHDTRISDFRRLMLNNLSKYCNFGDPKGLIRLFEEDPILALTRWWFKGELLSAESLTGKEQAVAWSLAAMMLQMLAEGYVEQGLGASRPALGASITFDGAESGTIVSVPVEAKAAALRALGWKRKAVKMMGCCVLDGFDGNLEEFKGELVTMEGWCQGKGIVEEKDEQQLGEVMSDGFATLTAYGGKLVETPARAKGVEAEAR